MSLRVRLFLLFGGLLALLMAAQWWWVRTLSQDLSDEAGSMAVEIGNTVVALLEELDDLKLTDRQRELDENVPSERPKLIHRDVEILHLPQERGDKAFVFKSFSDQGSADRAPETNAGQPENRPGELARIEPEDGSQNYPPENDGSAQNDIFRGAGAHASVSYQFKLDQENEGGGIRRILRFEANHPASFSLIGSGTPLESIPVPSQGLRSRLDAFLKRWWLGSVILLICGLALAALVAHRVSAPLRQLADGAQRLGEGQLGIQVPSASQSEVATAISAFNSMSTQLAELDRQTRQLQAQQHLGEIGEIARGLAHSLRNPLNALGLSIEELASKRPDEENLAETARRQIRRIDRSLRSFLALSSSTNDDPITTAIDIVALAQDVVLEALQDGGHNVLINLETGDGQFPPLHGVEAEVRAVLQALLINATDASPDGERVTLHLSADSNSHRIEIADRGPGLPEAVRARLFTPHLTTKTHGSGMGLFLAHRIASTRYNGALTLEDRPSGGTLARLILRSRIEETDHVE